MTLLCRTVQEMWRSASGLTHAYLSIGRALERKIVDGRCWSNRSSEIALEGKTAVLGKLVVCVKVYRIVLVGDFLVKQE